MNDYERIRAVFEEVVDLPADRRRDAVDRLTSGDRALHDSVLALLDDLDDAGAAGFLAEPVLGGRLLLSTDDAAPASPTSIVRGYEIGHVIGAGSSGAVHHARATGPLAREVALKILRDGLPEQVRARFQREQRALAQLNHPGVAQVYDAGETDDGRPFVAVELIEGPWITRYAQERDLPWRERIALMVRVCEAVHAIHANGVLHRDLKPANILVAERNGRAEPKVIDFGASAFTGAEASGETQGPRLVGTLAYMAPEQLAGAERGDVRTDVFALGVITHEMLVGAHPFGAPDAPLADLVQRITAGARPALPDAFGPDRAQLDTVLDTACAVSPDDRYASAQHLGDDLRRVLAHLPVEARPPSPARRFALLLRRRPGAAALVALVVVVVALLAVRLADTSRRNAMQAAEMRRTVDVLVEGVLGELELLSGANAAREGLGELLLDRLDSLPAVTRDDQTIRQRVRVLHALSAVALDRGDAARAVEFRTEALALLEPLSARAPDDDALVEQLTLARILLGDAYKDARQLDLALAVYRDVHASIERRLRERPGDAALRDDLCWSYERIGALLLHTDTDEALRLAKARLVVARELFDEAPDAPARIFGLGCAEASLSIVHMLRGELDIGLAHARSGVLHNTRAALLEPHRFAFRTRDVIARGHLTRMLLMLDDPEALEAAAAGAAVARRTLAANPDSRPAMGMSITAFELAAVAERRFGSAERAAALEAEADALKARYPRPPAGLP
ncbi:MAG: protein kinase [Phycisphaerales bacterium]